MGIIRQTSIGMRRDPDTIRIVDWADSDLSHYFEVNVDEANNLIDFLAKIGDFRFKDVDDATNVDIFQITGDPAASGILKLTSNITNSNIFEIRATGTISGASVTVDIDYFRLDLDAIVLNDGAANALNIVGQRIDFNGATLTGITLSTIHGIYIDMPSGLGIAGKTMAGAYIKDGEGNIVNICNGSVGVSATGINEEKYYKCEDFDEEAAAVTLEAGVRADEWTNGGTGASDDDITYIAGAGGVIELETDGADNDSVGIYWIGTTVLVDSNPILEFRFRVDGIGAADVSCLLGLTETINILDINNIVGLSDDICLVGMNSDLGTPAEMRLWTNDTGGGETVSQLGVSLVASQWCTVRIDCTDTEQIRVWINNTGGAITSAHEIAVATVGAGTIQGGIAMFPMIFIQSLDAGPSTTALEVDYCKIWQDRS